MKEKAKKEEEEPQPPAPPIIRIAKMNSPEWMHLLLGALGAAGAGAMMPAFSIVFSKLLRVGHTKAGFVLIKCLNDVYLL